MISDKRWSDFSQADYTPEQWYRACLIHREPRPGQDRHAKELCSLPVLEPDGTLNRNAVHAAAGRLGQVVDVTPAQRAKARARLRGLYRRIGEEPPDSLTREATMTTIDPGFAVRWRDNLLDVLRESVDQHGGDPKALLDSRRFVESLDPPTEDDIGDDAFAAIVAELAAEAVAENPSLRVTEANGYETDDEDDDDDDGDDDETVEAVESIAGRVLEAKGTDEKGGRVFRVRIIKAGTSKNGNRYTEAVLRDAAHRYEGAKAYDHHRSDAELRSSTLAGLVGSYRNVEAVDGALDADLHLLPSATHTAEALDRAIDNQAKGLAPLVGISHDVKASFRPYSSAGGRRTREAVSIDAVQSADVVADPSAGGHALHTVESTQTSPPGAEHTQESTVPVTKADLLAAFRDLSDDELAAAGLNRTGTTESVTPSERVVENTRVTEGGVYEKTSFLGGLVVRHKAEAAALSARLLEAALPDRFTEADIDTWVAAYKDTLAVEERAGLAPRNTAVVTRESRDKKLEALDAFFTGDFTNGYRSFKSAYLDITGHRPDFLGREDLNKRIIRESFGGGFDSGERVTESADSTTWAQLLGDSVTRRVIAEYGMPSLQTWRQIVSDVQPVEDFREQKVGRMGGYGTLPAVNQGAAYQPLTTPPDEEATYTATKRGGTEDLTLETIANDDRRVIAKIPTKLGRAAAQTLYRFVWDMLVTPVTCTYDSTALFHANHNNTDTSSALSQTTLGVGRRKMRDQTAFGDAAEVLGFGPRFLVVPNELEELAFQLTRSAVAVPATPAGPSDTPNINAAQNLDFILVPYLSDANDWFLVADPGVCPTIEIGFYQGRQEPEVFTQADNTVGSMFNADKMTWKIRHIYSGTALDHRAFYRGQG